MDWVRIVFKPASPLPTCLLAWAKSRVGILHLYLLFNYLHHIQNITRKDKAGTKYHTTEQCFHVYTYLMHITYHNLWICSTEEKVIKNSLTIKKVKFCHDHLPKMFFVFFSLLIMIISHLALNLKKGYPQEPLVFFSLFLHYIFHNFPYRPATGITL